ncbi:hypothetical protein TSAR_011264 [Trichomalopsis sarcophagae]|uniref:Uncharacterized protein n=1 Tax=Trichomalopsis sarcophagae TaxID=543379 RepID=A0A232FAE8_9HYME|nr:hypothetical protein TSAR_011264 [Trichomalopsis sarcophagae]
MGYSPTQDRLTSLPVNVALPLLNGLVAPGSTSSVHSSEAEIPLCQNGRPSSWAALQRSMARQLTALRQLFSRNSWKI